MISVSRLNELSEIIARSNALAQKVSQRLLGKKKYDVFRAALRNEFSELTIHQRRLVQMIPASERGIMLEVESFVNEISTEFMKYLRAIANKFAARQEGGESGEFLGEAFIALRKAIYGYNDSTYKFVTYVKSVLRSELNRYWFQNQRQHLNSRNGEYTTILRATLTADAELYQILCRQPTYEDILAYLLPKFPKVKNFAKKLTGVMTTVVLGEEESEGSLWLSQQNNQESRIELQDVLNSVPMDVVTKEIFWCRLQDNSYDAIADKMSISKTEVKKHLQAAKRSIHKKMAA